MIRFRRLPIELLAVLLLGTAQRAYGQG